MLQLDGHEAEVTCVAFSLDGTLLASGSMDKTIRLWQAGTANPDGLVPCEEAVYDLAFAPDGRTLVSAGSDRGPLIWDVRSLEGVGIFEGRAAASWNRVAFSADGSTFAAGVGHRPGGMTHDFTVARAGVTLWNASSGREILHIDTSSQPIWDLGLSPDGRLLALGFEWAGVGIRDLFTGKQWALIRKGNRHATVHGLSFSPNGQTLAATLGKTIELWDLTKDALRRTLEGHADLVLAVAYSADGRVLISGSKDDTVRVWDAHSGTLVGAYDWQVGGINAVAISPDGTLAAACGTGRVVVWDVD